MTYKVWLKVEWTKNSWTGKDQMPIITPSVAEIEKLKDWCREKVGANGWNYYGYYRIKPCEFRFKRSEDLLAFKLTFGLL
jgi:hypothetical protein